MVTVFRELRDGLTDDGKTKLKSPSGTLSTAEAISVVTSGIALAAHFGDGTLRAADVAAGILGAVVKDPVQDRVVWQEYLETVVKRPRRLDRPLPQLPRGQRLMTVTLLGIRHHGPGSARAVAAALAELKPDVILIEGPPEADALIPLAAHPAMRPPVALLVYADADPSRAGFWPFAEFSPEWVAIRHGVADGIPVRFIDLPSGHRFAGGDEVADVPEDDESRGGGDGEGQRDLEGEHALETIQRTDPIAALASRRRLRRPRALVGGRRRAARRRHLLGPGLLRRDRRRDDRGARPGAVRRTSSARRTCASASARRSRPAVERIAVVCGAFHVPALAAHRPGRPGRQAPQGAAEEGEDHARPGSRGPTAGCPSAPATAPASSRRAGTTTCSPRRTRSSSAGSSASPSCFRAEDLPVSSAHLIEATRLAETLATLRGRTLAGLTEVDRGRAVRALRRLRRARWRWSGTSW